MNAYILPGAAIAVLIISLVNLQLVASSVCYVSNADSDVVRGTKIVMEKRKIRTAGTSGQNVSEPRYILDHNETTAKNIEIVDEIVYSIEELDQILNATPIVRTEVLDYSNMSQLIENIFLVQEPAIYGTIPKTLFEKYASFGDLMARLISDPERKGEITLSPQAVKTIKSKLHEQFIMLNEAFSSATELIRDLDNQYRIKSGYFSLMSTLRTFWMRRDKPAKKGLLDECHRGAADRTIMGLENFLFDDATGFLTECKEDRYTEAGYANARKYIELITAQIIMLRSFCYGLEGHYIHGNGVISMYAEDNERIVNRLNEIGDILYASFWDEEEGILEFTCEALKAMDYENVATKAQVLAQKIQSEYGQYGDVFGVVVAKYLGDVQYNGFVVENETKSEPVLMAHRTSNYIFINWKRCAGLQKLVEVVLVRDRHGAGSSKKNIDLFFKSTAETFRADYVDDSVGFSLANAMDTVRYSDHKDRKLRCKVHYISRSQQDDLVGVFTNGFESTIEAREFRMDVATMMCNATEHYQIYSFCLMVLYQLPLICLLATMVAGIPFKSENAYKNGTGTTEELKNITEMGKRIYDEMKGGKLSKDTLAILENITQFIGEDIADEVDKSFRALEKRFSTVQKEFQVKASYDSLWYALGTFRDYTTEENRVQFIRECQKDGFKNIITGIYAYIDSDEEGFFMTHNKEFYYTFPKFAEVPEMLLELLHVVINVRGFCYGLEGLNPTTDFLNETITKKNDIIFKIRTQYNIQAKDYWTKDFGLEAFVCQVVNQVSDHNVSFIAQKLVNELQHNYAGYVYPNDLHSPWINKPITFSVVVSKSVIGPRNHGLADETANLARAEDTEKVQRTHDYLFISNCTGPNRAIEVLVARSSYARKKTNVTVKDVAALITTELPNSYLPHALGWTIARAADRIRIKNHPKELVPRCIVHYIHRGDPEDSNGASNWKGNGLELKRTTTHFEEKITGNILNFTLYSIC